MAAGDLKLSATVEVPTVAEIADAVLDAPVAGRAPGSLGDAVEAASQVADPLRSPVPGSYAPGTGGAALGRLTGAPVTVVSSIDRRARLTLVRGDSYLAADGNAIVLPVAEGDAWPADLTGWALQWAARPYDAERALVEASTVTATDAVAPGQALRLELAAAVTAQLAPGVPYGWDVQASKGQSVITLRRGTLEVASDAVR